ncbi:hypothetical protein SAMN05192553_10769 [Cyclobacterium xiamenense]|uniref:Phosphate-selective porin O and P n=1 Tax=Cyclobacterium xiamenense TaxID=1297121 RepID=A0A1H7AHN7_9BACT|nr:hypothetical protein [Cyclobacterium xiamenense]SEJ65153.1 hypothetical protein SAMN05192553_10769 [Cyclobacterium xiamenense]
MKKNILILAGAILCSFSSLAQQRDMQFWRAYDQRGINVFETGKADTVAFDGVRVRIGGAFAQQFQSLSHENAATPFLNDNGINTNQLMDIGSGFNLATANLNIDVALADGVRLNLITYLSSRHHPETWVKGGYLQFDKLPFLKSETFDQIMEKLTIKVGHMEINYGDSHFRRSDNGNAFYNPFVGNYIMDAFATEIGAEVIYQDKGFLAVASMTGGEIQGGVTNPSRRKPAFIGKLGYDKTLDNELRLRLTGSMYTTSGSVNNTLWSGDRAGSRYYLVMENTLASTSGNFTSGRFNPGMRDNVTALVLNPFVSYGGLELFGTLEQSKGKAANETEDRTWNQLGVDAVYRFGSMDKFYLAGRYNQAGGEMPNGLEPSISRAQIGAGWFITKNILAKLEYVSQQYQDFAPTDIRNGGSFNGLMIEGVIGF